MTTLIASSRDYGALVQEDRVHSAIFTDEQIFQDEMERIFHRTWLFALHESEIPNFGDFKRIQLGRYPIIATRNEKGEVQLLINRCRHRGAQVCEAARGNAKRFQCWYHGWTYDTTGDLVGVTGPEAYDEDFKPEQYSLAKVARIGSYRGFVFASLAEHGMSLDEYLGPTKQYFDIMVDSSPTGELEVKPGVVNKTMYRGNWKQVGMDGYHPHYVHMSVFKIFSKRESTTGSAVGAIHLEDPFADASKSRTRGFPHGHACLDFREQRRPHGVAAIEELNHTDEGRKYVEDMVAAYGQERAQELIAWHGDPHLGIFPNLQLIHDHVRVVIPISPGETEVLMYPVFLKGVGQSINEKRLRAHEAFYGPAAAGSPDDAEIFERTQRGLLADAEPWILLGRGIRREQVDEDSSVAGCISDEITQRAQMQEWKRLMTAR
ncbi:aromatic ring-hydroxylating oxygenase subunit alpha [Pseudomonas sp. SST3]|jgi:phenylpropionate dioxygenase-like ring-hydroxylating dioxygenase large terminal subunit|uniref:aromatic ring-hydroxylating oxygenase subunit alpha n=1 Tax=Pseudomonas sp. SST3 TaxID=2267882 RepID=UPI000DFFA75F|nr:aromatic ring-hydroxylating dioxygenase subunit alpha [Pseudomonas sp. SST3]NKQ12835.1 Rieske 2Fe-2S domain-containing protein [Pseudomonas sp. SST3]